RNVFLTGTQSGASAVDNFGGASGSPVLLDQVLLSANTLSTGLSVRASSFTTVQNSTVNGNRSGVSVVDPSATVSLLNDTISSNTQGGIGNVNGGTVSATNTIIALNSPVDCASPLTSSVTSLDSATASSTWGFGLHVTSFSLGALTANGGRTQTRSITASSQAFNVGTGACPPNDQRGSAFARETGRNCDLGAYGVIRADLAVTKTAPATATLNQAFTYTISVTNNGP